MQVALQNPVYPERFALALLVWHSLLGVGLLLGSALWLANNLPGVDIVRGAAALSAGLIGICSLVAVVFIARRDHLGRTLSLTANYCVFLASAIGLASALDLFAGLDNLADYAAQGTPFLMGLVVILGYALANIEWRGRVPSALRRRLGRGVMAAGSIGLALMLGIVPAILSLPGKLVASAPLSIGFLLLIALTLALMRLTASRSVARAFGAKNIHSERLSGWLFLSPNLLGFLLFFAGPLLFSLYVSFTNWDAFNRRDWIGLENYQRAFGLIVQPLASPDQPAREAIDIRTYSELLRVHLPGQSYLVGARDRLFWISLRNTLVFGLLAVPLSVVPALFLAVLLNSRLPGMRIYRTLYFIPSVAAVVGVALIWQWMYNSQVGWINYFISSAVDLVNRLFGLRLQDPQIRWLADSDYALLSVVIMSAWQWTGFNTVLFLAGLQTIPRELYEAATVDGAGPRQQFFNITLPMLAPTTLYVLITSSIQALQVFDQVFVISNGTGGPGTSTLTMTLNLYQNGFQSFRQGYASALAWVLFIVIFAFTLFQFRRQRQASGAYDL
ncbi:MAG: sugar ABC transporter permease [Anaerolineae bacterium]|nr:sugar ABC transporter permease [Anaerolineae bacterium]